MSDPVNLADSGLETYLFGKLTFRRLAITLTGPDSATDQNIVIAGKDGGT